MKEKNIKTGLCSLRLENIEKSLNMGFDYTIKKATFSILDFKVSGNRQLVTKTECEKAKDTLLNKPLLCQYIPSDNYDTENPNDDFGDHMEVEIELRDGKEYITTLTHAIGTCISVYIGTIKDENNNDMEVLLADFLLWFDRYPNEILLINDFYEKGENLYSSCEYYYTSYTINESGFECPKDITFAGHTILGSRTNKVAPSYQSSELISFNSKWNKAINSLKSNNYLDYNKLNKTSKEENNSMENKFLKALNELSIGDLRSSIMSALGDVMTGNEYENLWISNYGIFSESKYFIYETYEDSKWVNYKVTYSLGENDSIVLNYEGKEKVEGQYTYVSVNELEKSSNELVEKENKINELNETIISLNEKVVEKSTNEKEKVGELQTTLASLNSKIEEMKPIVDEYNKAQFEKAFNEASENFKAKFISVNALDVFEDKTTQELIKESVNSDETISNKAKFSLNSLIVENIKSVVEIVDTDDIMSKNEHISINSVQKLNDTENLINNDTDSIYAEEYGINYK